MVGSSHMVCLKCTDEVYAVLPEKIACLSLGSVGALNFGPPKGGDLESNLRIFCPVGNAYLPLTGGLSGECSSCLNENCARCKPDDLVKCLGCPQSRIISPTEDCVASNCGVGEYLSIGQGNKCLAFLMNGC